MAQILPVYCFLDESGTFLGNESTHFALGAIIHPWPDDLTESLHEVLECLIGDCKRHRTSQEFHFADLTEGTLKHFLKCVECLEKDTDWRFFSLVLDLQDPKFIKPKDALQAWAYYLRWTKILLEKKIRPNEKATLLADFYKAPKARVHKLATLPAVVPNLWDVLQVESQGVLLVQMADLLLGATLYTGVSSCKNKLAERVKALKESLPKSRFDEWRVRWP
jgi:hypothetical protein